MKLLNGKVETITMTDFRTAPGDVIAQVLLGKVYILTSNGKAVAKLCPTEDPVVLLGAEVRRLGLQGQ